MTTLFGAAALTGSIANNATYTIFGAGVAAPFNSVGSGKRLRAVVIDTTDDSLTARGEIVVWGGAAPIVEVLYELTGALEFENISGSTDIKFRNKSGVARSYKVFREELS